MKNASILSVSVRRRSDWLAEREALTYPDDDKKGFLSEHGVPAQSLSTTYHWVSFQQSVRNKFRFLNFKYFRFNVPGARWSEWILIISYSPYGCLFTMS